jgi:hypothetical protein
MSFTTTGTQDNGNGGGKYLKPGINNTTIGTIEGTTPEQGSPYIEVKFYKEGETIENSTGVRFYMSEKGRARSLEKIKHIATKVVKEAEVDSIQAETLEDYASKLQNLLMGKSLRMKFVGEEYVNASNQVKVKTTIGLPSFAEAIYEGGEYPIVEETKLKYNENNSYDMKKLEKASPETAGSESTGKLGW